MLRAQGKETWGSKGIREPVNFEPVFRRLNKFCVCDKCHSSNDIQFQNRVHESSFVESPDGEFYNIEGKEVRGCQEKCGGQYRRIRLFADSNSDWLDPKWSVETLAKFLDAIRLAPNVDVQLLTKRIELWRERMLDARNVNGTSAEFRYWMDDWYSGVFPKNVWLGVSAEGQKEADERIPQLLRTPAAIRFVSAEPLLETINFHFDGIVPKDISPNYQPLSQWIDWLIVGGESGDNRRDCGVDAIEHVVRQCAMAGVPVYCKQDVAFKSGQRGRIPLETWKRKEFPR